MTRWLRRWGGWLASLAVAIAAIVWGVLGRRRAARLEAGDRAVSEVGRAQAGSTAVSERDRGLAVEGATVEAEIREGRAAAASDDLEDVRARVEARAHRGTRGHETP